MKNVAFTCVLACVFFTSCRKDWNCTCDCKATTASKSVTRSTEIKSANRSQANSACSDFGQDVVNGNGTWKCKITPK
jgi:hypothetical protein